MNLLVMRPQRRFIEMERGIAPFFGGLRLRDRTKVSLCILLASGQKIYWIFQIKLVHFNVHIFSVFFFRPLSR